MTAETNEVAIDKVYQLNAIDRCDQCSAQAYVLVKGVAGSLMFCGHHYNKNEKALSNFAYEVIDERERLIDNKLIGSHN